jgi:hypothetical protein
MRRSREIKAVDASSASNNIELQALVSNEIRSRTPFSAIWVTLSLRNTGNYSDDNDDAAASGFASTAGEALGSSRPGQNNVVIKGSVSPSDLGGSFAIKRKFVSLATYGDSGNGSTLRIRFQARVRTPAHTRTRHNVWMTAVTPRKETKITAYRAVETSTILKRQVPRHLRAPTP